MIMHKSLFRCNPKITFFYKLFSSRKIRLSHNARVSENQVVPRGKIDSMLCKSTMT